METVPGNGRGTVSGTGSNPRNSSQPGPGRPVESTVRYQPQPWGSVQNFAEWHHASPSSAPPWLGRRFSFLKISFVFSVCPAPAPTSSSPKNHPPANLR
ncbi:uncharacterized protein P884DRAFT_260366 [Thermothelomyces heterothallicus CBS 202.75]|uniref:uncharacterized protein n=1 Tax=Thermothelomyces heterothallicus CBS 202.75 TaxID=1149848 RepID=UPI0037440D74